MRIEAHIFKCLIYRPVATSGRTEFGVFIDSAIKYGQFYKLKITIVPASRRGIPYSQGGDPILLRTCCTELGPRLRGDGDNF